MLIAVFVIAAIVALVWAVRKGIAASTAKETLVYVPTGTPIGFNASHAHKNIAIDANAGTIWARDAAGFSKVLNRSDVVRWSVDSTVFNNGVTGKIEHKNVNLVITTKDLDRPIIRVRFNGHSDVSMGGGNSNFLEAESWSSRLTAFSAQ